MNEYLQTHTRVRGMSAIVVFPLDFSRFCAFYSCKIGMPSGSSPGAAENKLCAMDLVLSTKATHE